MKTLLLMFLAMLAACSSRQEEPQAIPAEATVPAETTAVVATVGHPPAPREWDSILATAPPLDPCEVARHVTLSLDSIRRWPLRITRAGSEDCRFAVLDSLVEGFVRSGEDRYLEALDSLQLWSDTHFAEAFGEITGRLLERRGGDFVAYLSARGPDAAPLERELVRDWRLEIEGSPDSVANRERLLAEVRAAVPDTALDAAQRSHLEAMFRRAHLLP